METKKVEHFKVSESGNAGVWRGGQSSDTKSLVFLTAVLVALIGSAGALTTMLSGGEAPDAVPGAVVSAQPAPDSAPAVPYFPSHSDRVSPAPYLAVQPYPPRTDGSPVAGTPPPS